MILLKPGTEYTLDGVKHKIPSTEVIVGRPFRYTPEYESFLIKIKKILKHFHEKAQEHNIKYYISCATVLGLVKFKGFIPWDDDADVCIPSSEVHKIEKAFANSPYKLIKFQYGYKLASTTFPYYPFVDIMVVDIDPEVREPSYRFSYPIIDGKPSFKLCLFFPNKVHPLKMIYPLKLYKFEDFEVWGPNDVIGFCKQNYGPECFYTSKMKSFNTHMFSAVLPF